MDCSSSTHSAGATLLRLHLRPRYLHVLAATPIANLLETTGAECAVIPTIVINATCAGRAGVPMTATCAIPTAAPIAHLGITVAGRAVVPTTVMCAVLAATPIAHQGITEAERAAASTRATRAVRILYRNC